MPKSLLVTLLYEYLIEEFSSSIASYVCDLCLLFIGDLPTKFF